MKKILLTIGIATTMFITNTIVAKEKLTIINIDSKGVLQTPSQLRSMVSLEIEKLNTYQVLGEYDMTYILKEKQLDLTDCYGTICASKLGEALSVDKIVTGSVERIGEKIIYSLRVIDVKTNQIENTSVLSFENLQPYMEKMTKFAVHDLLDIKIDPIEFNQLKYVEDPIVNSSSTMKASGFRMGLAYVTPGVSFNPNTDNIDDFYLTTKELLEAEKKYPVLLQIGYQLEVQYLSSGNFQALFETVGLISGLDQNLFIPSITLLNGFRNTKSGFEIAFGPTFSLIKNYNGTILSKTKWAWAFGKTFKSGNMNIPVNIYITPDRQYGWYLGGSFGFNLARKRK